MHKHIATTLTCLLTLTACIAVSTSHATEKKPNILWIFPEDVTPFMGCYGDPINADHTPAIDGLAADGVLFERAYVTAPVCSASRSAIITGVMATTTGTHLHRSSRAAEGTIVPEEVQIHLPEGMKTIPELMKEAGYFTFNAGKEDYNFHYDRRALYDAGTKTNYEAGMNGWQGNWAQHKEDITKDTWNARTNKDQPWFGQITLRGGKGGKKYVRKGELLKAYDVPMPAYFPDIPELRESWTAHYNAVRGTDAEVENVINQLKADGEYDNTIIFFFSDHGSPNSLRHKQFCYEGGIHVPLIITGDHPALSAGVRRAELVSSMDISATTLAFGGAVMPDYLDGQDLFGKDYAAIDHVISARDRCDFTIDRIRSVTTQKYSYIRNYFPDRALLQPQYRDGKKDVKAFRKLHAEGKLNDYLEEHWFGTRPDEELYDLEADPDQLQNLASNPEYRSILEKNRETLNTWIETTDEQGQYPESATQLRGTYDLWKVKPAFMNAEVNPEYDQFK